jgi:HEPN domain-containing protein
MQSDAARLADTRAWLAKARTDLRSAEHALAASPPLAEDVAFHAQQAAEKAMKALLTWHDVPFRKTHSREELGQQCVAVEPTPLALVDQAAPLTEYAWRFRYPGEDAPPTPEEVDGALQTARAVVAAVSERLPQQARS